MRQTLNPQTPAAQKRSNLGFFEILSLGGLWLVISLTIIWQYIGEFISYLYYICQASWESLSQHLPAGIHFIFILIPCLMIMTLGRGIFLFIIRLQATQRFTRTLGLFQIQPSPRLAALAGQVGLQTEALVCFDAPTVQAFSLGAWRPRVWLSTGLLALLDDDELTAVLHHEVHHCQKRDPLRLLVSRLISDSFFFVPLLCHLADHNHLVQEMAADGAVLDKMGDVAPLASALHKLLTRPGATGLPMTAPAVSYLAISQLNVTERRILALVSPTQQPRWPGTLSRWLASLLIGVFFLASTFFIQPLEQGEPVVSHSFDTCTATTAPMFQLKLPEQPTMMLGQLGINNVTSFQK